MRSNFHPQPYPAKQYNEFSYQTQGFHRSPPPKTGNCHQEIQHTQSHSLIFYNPNADQNKKQLLSNVKNQEERLQPSDILLKKKTTKIDKLYSLKAQTLKEQQAYGNNHDTSTKASDPNIRREESEPDLRTSCPNIFRKFQQNSALRSTMQIHNLPKFGNIMAEIKKQDDDERQTLKKSQNHTNQPLTPGPRLESTNSPLFKKNSTTFRPFALTTQKEKQKEKGREKQREREGQQRGREERKKLINGFDISRQLGKGKFGQVYLAQHYETGFIVALKKIVKSKLKEYKMIQQFKREIRLHSALDHPNIVKFYGFFEHEDNIYLILEYVSGGTLFDYMAEKDILSSKQTAEYLRDTIEALTYMHDKSIAHRDIKPENIVLTVQKVAKLCDFGWSALIESSRTTYCGTFDYAPPEILERKNYDTAVDIWCIGVLTYEMLTGRVPFEGEKRKQIMQKILSVDVNKIYYPVDVPDDAKGFIQWLVQKDPTQRPKCRDLLRAPFFANNLKKDKKL